MATYNEYFDRWVEGNGVINPDVYESIQAAHDFEVYENLWINGAFDEVEAEEGSGGEYKNPPV